MKALKRAVTSAVIVGVSCSSSFALAGTGLTKNELKHAPEGCAYVLTAVPNQANYNWGGPEPAGDVMRCHTWLSAFRDHDANAQALARQIEKGGPVRMGVDYWRREAEATGN